MTVPDYTRRTMARMLHWFRRDLRLADNTALAAAVARTDGDVIPVFVLDPRLLGGRDVAPARVAFMFGCLRDLDTSLRRRGSRLIVRAGDPAVALLDLARETGASAVSVNRDYTPLARRRDARVTAALESAGLEVVTSKDCLVFEPGEVMSQAGTPYTVFTPFKRAWLGLPRSWRTQPAPANFQPPPDLTSQALPEPDPNTLALPAPGEQAGFARLREFCRGGGLDAYGAQRDNLSGDGTSRLSAHLRFGALSPRQAAQAAIDAGESGGAQTYLSELIWREFYAHVLFHFPGADTANFNHAYDPLVWGSGDTAEDARRFQAWTEGRTGYPIVDAAMRQMAASGWMHNRARMIVASFLTKDLHLDWRLGEAHFMRSLADGDPASNNGGWQWAASTGTDAQPYFRIFNPILQSKRFDPDGAYARRWVPELAEVATADVHAPWEMPPLTQRASRCVIGVDYPAPIVDHAIQKAEILRRFGALKGAAPQG